MDERLSRCFIGIPIRMKTNLALTKACSMGPLADFVRRCGGSSARVFQRAGLPLEIAYQPERMMLLRDQLRVVECAMQEVGDPAFAARLSIRGGFASLGAYGLQVLALPCLAHAIDSAGQTMSRLLQAGTEVRLAVCGDEARWTYRVTAPMGIGRRSNEILALGYMFDLLQHFGGARWTPLRIELPGVVALDGHAFDDVFRCEVVRGEIAAVVFPRAELILENHDPTVPPAVVADPVPDMSDLVGCIVQLVAFGLLTGRMNIERLCQHTGIPRRSLQRALASRGIAFKSLMNRLLRERAIELLRRGATVTETALELGYSDPAHFTRAFRSWTGEIPSAFRGTLASPRAVEARAPTVCRVRSR